MGLILSFMFNELFMLFLGILEVHQLGFTCVMTSEGSKCEAVTKSSNPQSQSLKVSMEHAKSQFQEPAGTSPPYPYKDEDLPFFVR